MLGRRSSVLNPISFCKNLVVFPRSFTVVPRHCTFTAMASGSPSRNLRIGTHSGTFHCDEALGCFMLRLTDKFYGADIVRTRDQKVLDTLDAVLDVGGVYDHDKHRYDHHQRGFDQSFGNGFTTKLSSAGLIYKHFGLEIISKEVGLYAEHPNVNLLYLAVYKSFVEAVDAIDNGINQYDTDKPPRYINNTHLSSRVGRLNLDWTEDYTAEKENERFHCAMNLAGNEFLQCVNDHARSWLPARSIVEESLVARKECDSSGEIMVLKKYCPWKLHLFELEQELKVEPSVKYVVYEDTSSQWRVQAVAVSPDRFESRKALPESWRGLRDEDLSKECGIPNGVFVHASGFIGGNKTFDGALAMAKAALQM